MDEIVSRDLILETVKKNIDIGKSFPNSLF